MEERLLINDRVINEVEGVLRRSLQPDELRLLLLARIIEEEILDRSMAAATEEQILIEKALASPAA